MNKPKELTGTVQKEEYLEDVSMSNNVVTTNFRHWLDIIQFENRLELWINGDVWNQRVLTLSDFIDSCLNAGIELKWRQK